MPPRKTENKVPAWVRRRHFCRSIHTRFRYQSSSLGVKLEGALTGDLLLALPEADAENLATMLGYAPADGWGGLAESALMESGNIVGSAFVTAVGALVREKLLLSVPTFARGSGRSCVERLVAHAGSVALATRFSAWAE